MSYFSEEQLNQLEAGRIKANAQARELKFAYGNRVYANEQAKEFAYQGLIRRVGVMEHCLNKVFTILPPHQEEIPEPVILKEAEVQIQAFIINLYGAFDNLAWVWVREMGLKKEDGSPLPKSKVGLTKKMKLVRASFSESFQELLKERDTWFEHLENFRHALAHRIPLYIPPYCVDPKHKDEHAILEKSEDTARSKGNIKELERIKARQKEIMHFKPFMRHSFLEGGPTVPFHPELLAYFATIHDTAMNMVQELSSQGS